MSSSQSSAPAAASIAQHNATQRNAISRNDLNLLGLFGDTKDLKAMVRLPNGRIKTVKTGSRVNRSTVLGIDANGIILERSGQATRITMPGG